MFNDCIDAGELEYLWRTFRRAGENAEILIRKLCGHTRFTSFEAESKFADKVMSLLNAFVSLGFIYAFIIDINYPEL